MQNPITSTLDAEQQSAAGEALQGSLVDLIDLSLIAKQAHWNVIGTNFRSVHLALDELVTVAREFTDSAAERATAIGVSPDGRASTVAGTSSAKGFGEGWTKDTDVIASIVENLAAVIERAAGAHRRHRERRPRDAGPAHFDHRTARAAALDVAGAGCLTSLIAGL